MLGLRFLLLALYAGLLGLVSSQADVCIEKVVSLALQLRNFPEVLPTDPTDLGVLLFTGKGLYDMGTKEICEISPGLRYLMASPQQPTFIGVCIYEECSVDTLNTMTEFIPAGLLPFPV